MNFRKQSCFLNWLLVKFSKTTFSTCVSVFVFRHVDSFTASRTIFFKSGYFISVYLEIFVNIWTRAFFSCHYSAFSSLGSSAGASVFSSVASAGASSSGASALFSASASFAFAFSSLENIVGLTCFLANPSSS